MLALKEQRPNMPVRIISVKMKINKYEYPWEHYEITEILSVNNFNTVKEYSDSYSLPENGRHTNFVENNNSIYTIFKNIIIDFCEHINCDITNKYFLLEHSICSPNYKYNRIHTDNPNKLLTFVYYLSDDNFGTKLYKEKTIESKFKYSNWSKNGGMAFIRNENTFHDFEANETVRRTFNLILLNNKNLDSFIDYKYFCSLI